LENRLLIGEPTFGKDSIQLIFDLEDDSSLHVTAAKWWFPGNTVNISENGLQPDILVTASDSDSDLIMKIAIKSLLEQP
jgi:C-terminal processing protease CtpA/Prc